jgi:hypothetical protein
MRVESTQIGTASTQISPSRRMRAKFLRELAALGLPGAPAPSAPVADDELAALHGKSVTARAFVDEDGALVDFSTTDRFGEDPAHPGEMVRARWSTPVRGFERFEGVTVPIGGKAVWHFPSGDFTYADFELSPGDLELDVPAGTPGS